MKKDKVLDIGLTTKDRKKLNKRYSYLLKHDKFMRIPLKKQFGYTDE